MKKGRIELRFLIGWMQFNYKIKCKNKLNAMGLLNDIRLIIFDFDGVLVDTQQAVNELEWKYLTQHGVNRGMGSSGTVKALKQYHLDWVVVSIHLLQQHQKQQTNSVLAY